MKKTLKNYYIEKKRLIAAKKHFSKALFGALVFVFLFALAGCADSVENEAADYADLSAENLSDSVQSDNVPSDESQKENGDKAVRNFGIRLLQEAVSSDQDKNRNLLISPLSAVFALAMTANGADGETLQQTENVLGMSVADMNVYLHYYNDNLRTSKKFKMEIANSIWFKDGSIDVDRVFLQTNADYYKADIFKAAFDQSTVNDINNWVGRKTDGMIENMIDNVPTDSVMYLINALSLQAKWKDEYSEVREGIFTTADGNEQNVDFMYSEEEYYLEDDTAVGFMKYYAGGKRYAFVALLPTPNLSVEEYANSMTGEKLQSLLENSRSCIVKTKMPKFKAEYEIQLNDILKKLGMEMPFDRNNADFSRIGKTLGDGNIYISEVLQKTYIDVDEKGTEAAAATSAEMMNDSVDSATIEYEEVYLDRPFIYMVVDCNHNIPIFAGTMMSAE